MKETKIICGRPVTLVNGKWVSSYKSNDSFIEKDTTREDLKAALGWGLFALFLFVFDCVFGKGQVIGTDPYAITRFRIRGKW